MYSLYFWYPPDFFKLDLFAKVSWVPTLRCLKARKVFIDCVECASVWPTWRMGMGTHKQHVFISSWELRAASQACYPGAYCHGRGQTPEALAPLVQEPRHATLRRNRTAQYVLEYAFPCVQRNYRQVSFSAWFMHCVGFLVLFSSLEAYVLLKSHNCHDEGMTMTACAFHVFRCLLFRKRHFLAICPSLVARQCALLLLGVSKYPSKHMWMFV